MKYSLRESNRHLRRMRFANLIATFILIFAPLIAVIIGLAIYGMAQWDIALMMLIACWALAGVHHLTALLQEASYARSIARARLNGEMES